MHLKFAQKAILLVTIPLICELLFIVSLYQLLLQSEHTAAIANHHKEVSNETNSIITDLNEAVSSLVTFRITSSAGNRDRFNKVFSEIPTRFEKLVTLVADDTVQTEKLKHIRPELQQLLAFISNLQKQIASGNADDAMLAVDSWNNEIRLPFMHTLTSLKNLVDYQNTALNQDPAAEIALRDQFRLVLLIGFGANVILAALVWRFVKSTTKRVETLTENTMLLASGKHLRKLKGGDDEFGKLDIFFHHMADSLNDAQRKERAIVENVLDVIFSLDPSGKFVKVSPASTRAWGYTPDNLIGESIEKILLPEDIEETATAFKLAATADINKEIETRILRQDGNLIWIVISARWVQSERSLFCVAHDITARKLAENMKKEFLAMVSHDLRTPLNSVQSSLTLLSTGAFGSLSEKGMHIVETSETELGRLIQLINDLLDVSKMEAGKMELQFKKISLVEVIDTAINAVRGLAKHHDISINAPIRDVQISADGDRLVQVLVNLLSNAIKFSPDKSIIDISLEKLADTVRVSIIDQGRGVPAEFRTKIFERFQQIEHADSASKNGTGLGLAICKNIIDGHGGEIGVEPGQESGSVFWFTLPVSSLN